MTKLTPEEVLEAILETVERIEERLDDLAEAFYKRFPPPEDEEDT